MELLDPDIAAPGIWGSAGGQELPLLVCDRDNAVQSAKTTQTVLTSVIVRRPPQPREQLRHLRPGEGLRPAPPGLPEGADRQTQIAYQTLIPVGPSFPGVSRTYPMPSRALAFWSRMAWAAPVSIWGWLM
jgi:hypothetical protein